MFVTTAIEPATSLVSAQMRPTIVPTTSTATIAASQYRIRRLVMRRSLLSWGFRRSFRQALLVGAPQDNLPAEQGLKAGGVSTKGQGPLAYRCSSEVLNRHRERHVLRMATWKADELTDDVQGNASVEAPFPARNFAERCSPERCCRPGQRNLRAPGPCRPNVCRSID